MKQQKTKQAVIIRRFHELLRSGKDYTTEYMYAEAGKKCFIQSGVAGAHVRNYYRGVITDEMKEFVKSIDTKSYDYIISKISEKYNLCVRESKYILRFIRIELTKDSKVIIKRSYKK